MPWHVLICTSALMLLLQTNVNCRKRDDKLVHYRRTSLHNKIPDNVVHFIKYSHLARPRSVCKNQMNQRLIGQPILIENRDGQNLPPSQQYEKLQTLVKMLKAIVYDQELKKSREKYSEQVKRLINPSEFRKPSASFYQGRTSSHHNSLFNKKKQERYEDILKPVKNDRLTTPPSQLQNGTSQELKDKFSPKFRAFLMPKPQNTTIKYKNKKVSHAKETNLKLQHDISSKPLENDGRCMSNHKLKSQISKLQNNINSMGNSCTHRYDEDSNNEKADNMHNLKTGHNRNSQFRKSHSQPYHMSNSNLNWKNSKSDNDFIPHSNSHNPQLKKNFNVKVLNPQLDSSFNPKAKAHYDITTKDNLNVDLDNIDNTIPGNFDSSQSYSKNYNLATGHHANSKTDDTHSPQLQSKYIGIGNTKKGDEKNSNAIYKDSNAQSKNHDNGKTIKHYQSGSNSSSVGDYVISEKAHSPQMILNENHKHIPEDNHNRDFKNENHELKNTTNVETKHYKDLDSTSDNTYSLSLHNNPHFKDIYNVKIEKDDDSNNSDVSNSNISDYITAGNADFSKFPEKSFSTKSKIGDANLNNQNTKLGRNYDSGGSTNRDVSRSNIRDYKTVENADFSKFPKKNFPTKSKIGGPKLNNQNTKLRHDNYDSDSSNNNVSSSNISDHKTAGNVDSSKLQLNNNHKFIPEQSYPTKTKVSDVKLNNQKAKLGHDNYDSGGTNKSEISSSKISDYKTAGNVDPSKLQLKNNHKFIPENSFPTKSKIDDGKLNNHNTKLGHDIYDSGGSNSNISDSKTAGNVDSSKLQLKDNHKFIPDQSFPTKSKIGDEKLNNPNTKLGHGKYDSDGSNNSDVSSSNISDSKTDGNVDSSKLQIKNNHKFIPEDRFPTKSKIDDGKLNNQNTKLGHDLYDSGGSNSNISDSKTAVNVDSSKLQLKDNHKFIPDQSFPTKSKIGDEKLNNPNTKLGHGKYDSDGSNNSNVSSSNISDSKTAGNVDSSKLQLKNNHKFIPENRFPTKSKIDNGKFNNHTTKPGHDNYNSGGSNNSNVSSSNISDSKTAGNADSPKLQLKDNQSLPTKSKIGDAKLNNHNTKLDQDNYNSGSNNTDKSIPENSYSLQLQSKNGFKPISESDYNTNPKNSNLQSGNQHNSTINESYTNSSFDKNYDGVLKNVHFLQIPFNGHYKPYIIKDEEGKADNNYILNLDNSNGTILKTQSKTDSNTTIPYKGYETEFQNRNPLTVKIYRIKILKGYDFNNYHKLQFPGKILSLQLLPKDNRNSVYADESSKYGKTQSNNIYFSKVNDNYHFDPDLDTNLHSRKGYLSHSYNTISEGGYSTKLKNRVTSKNVLKLDIHNDDDSIAAKLWLSHANLKKGSLKKGHGTKLKHVKPQLENMYIDRINQNSDPGNTDNFIHKDVYSSWSRNGYNHNLVSQKDYTTAPKNKYNKHYTWNM